MWAVITDIRSERMARYCGIYAACLCCFFYWNYNVAVNVGIKYIDGVYTLVGNHANHDFDAVINLSFLHSFPHKDGKSFWSILLVVGACSVGTHYSLGFIILLWQALIVVISISGLILMPSVYCLSTSLVNGYVVLCAMFTGVIGPLFGGLEPAVLHVFSFCCAIIVGGM
jgi:hypothetical protein